MAGSAAPFVHADAPGHTVRGVAPIGKFSNVNGPPLTDCACTPPAGLGDESGRSSQDARNSTHPRTVKRAARRVPSSARSMLIGSLRVLSRVLGSFGVGASSAPPCCARATGNRDHGPARACRGHATQSVAAARRGEVVVLHLWLNAHSSRDT